MMKRILTFFLVMLLAISAAATDMRGLAHFAGPHGPYPATNILVNVFVQTPNGLLAVASPAVTDGQGMYYFYNMMAGSYVIRFTTGNTTVGQYQIFIPSKQPGQFFDIQPVLLMFPQHTS